LVRYGFWLPNDPRGSWSDFVGCWELVRFGKATKTTERRSVAHVPHNRRLREEAKRTLKYPPVVFSEPQALAVAQGFDRAGTESSYVIHACSILPEHVHLVIRRNEDRRVERMVGHLKARATQSLSAAGYGPPTSGQPGVKTRGRFFSTRRRKLPPPSSTWKKIRPKRGNRFNAGHSSFR